MFSRGVPMFIAGDEVRRSPGWSDPEARALAMTLGGFDGEPDIHIMLNM